ncbi:MAG: phosphoribosylanthranilate isomerase [Candidatus Hydrogenedentes bacterium]|nr:phosphoribosylanthranilate isomerase [Candidatus Hydrogenedentota bacterium]
MKVKICGITCLEDALAAVEAGADALGFNFAEEAKAKGRYIDPDDARNIVEQLPDTVLSVAVTVNEGPARLREYLEFVDRVQLHGEETPEMCREFGAQAIKAFRVGPDFTPERMQEYSVGAYLLDAFVPEQRGGTGTTCDWETARRARELGMPLVLAGGLTPENVAEAVRAVEPCAVDTAGGVESGPGKKDHERVRSFIHNAKASLSG